MDRSTILVTGANRGIGLALVRQLHPIHDVLATARDPERATELAATKARVLPLDVTSDESVARLAASLAGLPVDVIINNAGAAAPWGGTIDDLDLEVCKALFDLNALGAIRVSRALLPNLLAGRRKTLLHLSSRMGSIADNTSGGSHAYRMSKAALNMASRGMAMDWKGKGISSFVVHPGWVQTDMGGPGATVTPDESAAGILQLLEGDPRVRSGRFYTFKGHDCPY